MYYSNNREAKYSKGEVKSIGRDKKIIEITSKSEDDAQGGPIINLVNYKVIGVYKGKRVDNNNKIGTFMNQLINEINENNSSIRPEIDYTNLD